MMLKIAPLLAVFTAVALSGCNDGDDKDPRTGQIRVIHGSPDAPAVNVYVTPDVASRMDAAAAIVDLDYGQSSGYASFDEGNYDISIRGRLPNGELEVIAIENFPIASGEPTTFVAVNPLSAIAGAVVPESSAVPAESEVAIAVFHGATVAGAVDVYVTETGADISALEPAFTFGFGETVDAGLLPGGTYELQVALAGDAVPVYRSGPVDLAAFGGRKLLIAALDVTNDTAAAASPIQLLVAAGDDLVTLLDVSTPAGIKVAHLSPDAALAAGGPVEVYATSDAVGGTVELIDSFGYLDVVPDAASYTVVPPGEYVIDVAPDTGTIGDSVYQSPPLAFDAGRQYTAIAAGRVASTPEFRLMAAEDGNRPIATQASVRVAHAAPAAGDVDIFVTPAGEFSVADVEAGLAGEPLLSAFPFSAIGDYVALDPGLYDIRVVPLSLGVVAINVEALELTPGLVATIAARGPDESDGAPSDFGVVLLTN